jgi:hypothetical protein
MLIPFYNLMLSFSNCPNNFRCIHIIHAYSYSLIIRTLPETNALEKPTSTSTPSLFLLYPVDVLSRNRIPRRHIFLHALSEARCLAAR